MEMRLPNWVRLVVLVSTLMQLGFGAILLYDPGRITDLWPWPLPSLTARLLGASTLVSIPLALIAIGVNRFAVAMIPLVMMLTYRVLQLLAGAIHFDRFPTDALVTLNYFGGGALMLIVFGYPLWAGLAGRLPPAAKQSPLARPVPFAPRPIFRRFLELVGLVYILLGAGFLLLGGAAAPLWIDAQGMTPLTARLFASPLIGLGLGMQLVARAQDWRQVVGPAAGFVTIGILAMLAMGLEIDDLRPASPVAWLVAATPLLLLLIGARLLTLHPGR